jgi:hypothetical protein
MDNDITIGAACVGIGCATFFLQGSQFMVLLGSIMTLAAFFGFIWGMVQTYRGTDSTSRIIKSGTENTEKILKEIKATNNEIKDLIKVLVDKK